MTETDSTQGQVFESVWDALEDSPVEAASMRVRSDLLIDVQQAVARWELTPAEAARRLGVTQPRLDDMNRGHIDEFSLDDLIRLAVRAGLTVRVQVEVAAA